MPFVHLVRCQVVIVRGSPVVPVPVVINVETWGVVTGSVLWRLSDKNSDTDCAYVARPDISPLPSSANYERDELGAKSSLVTRGKRCAQVTQMSNNQFIYGDFDFRSFPFTVFPLQQLSTAIEQSKVGSIVLSSLQSHEYLPGPG